MEKKKWYDRLKDKTSEIGISQSELARQVEATQPTVHAWYYGKVKSPPLKYIKDIAKALHTTEEFLLYGEEGAPLNEHSSRREVPFGRFKLVLNEVCFVPEVPPLIGLASENTALKAVKVLGNAMQPRLLSDDIVVLDTSVQDIEDGSIYGLFINSRFVLAYLTITLSGDIVVSTENKEQELTLTEPPIIVGRVVFKAQSL